MNQEIIFLDFAGLEDHHKTELLRFICPQSKNPNVEFPWDIYSEKITSLSKGDGSFLNVYAPSFESSVVTNTYSQKIALSENMKYVNNVANGTSVYTVDNAQSLGNYHATSSYPAFNGNYIDGHYNHQNVLKNSLKVDHIASVSAESQNKACFTSASAISAPVGNLPKSPFLLAASSFKLSPTVSSFIPQNIPGFVSQASSASLSECKLVDSNMNLKLGSHHNDAVPETVKVVCVPEDVEKSIESNDCSVSEEHETNYLPVLEEVSREDAKSDDGAVDAPQPVVSAPQAPRTFADVLKSRSEQKAMGASSIAKLPVVKPHDEILSMPISDGSESKPNLKEDKMAVALGRHLYQLQLDFAAINLQPRGLINRRNWCYINATLQALLACSPFYTLLRNLPLGPAVDRGKSSTPVIDSMVKLSYEFTQLKEEMEDLQTGAPFQPFAVYDMLGILKSDCLKGQQEDAEEFLSFVLNGMHEEMVSVVRNYETLNNIPLCNEIKSNGHVDGSDTEDEWQVIGAKQRGMVTRKVVEQKTPISDLLGGQIKSFLTTSGNKTSASVQPFFTLQLDIQAENVSSVEEALNQMTVKEPIQGYTCTRTKQEVEAHSRIMLQKLPPVLILHLKRFIYNRSGGCKKVMKHTEYPIDLELKKDLFSPEAKKVKRPSSYKLFAVMYHDGAEAIIGHYISDIYHHGSKSWIRCDDRNISTITEAQVLSHSPPRVPYLLFYQACNSSSGVPE